MAPGHMVAPSPAQLLASTSINGEVPAATIESISVRDALSIRITGRGRVFAKQLG